MNGSILCETLLLTHAHAHTEIALLSGKATFFLEGVVLMWVLEITGGRTLALLHNSVFNKTNKVTRTKLPFRGKGPVGDLEASLRCRRLLLVSLPPLSLFGFRHCTWSSDL